MARQHSQGPRRRVRPHRCTHRHLSQSPRGRSAHLLTRPRILITRTRHQASALAEQLDALGAETILIPTIELAPPSSHAALDSAIAQLSNPINDVDFLIFTSSNAVHALAARAIEQGTALHPKRIAVIGPATHKALTEDSITPHTGPVLIPETYVAESLATALFAASIDAPQNFLLVRAEEARDIIASALEAAGHRVTIAPAYRNITPPGTISALQDIFASPATQPNIITFTSSSTAHNLFALLDSAAITLPTDIALASIGPITSASLRDLGHSPTIEAAEPTIEALTAAIATHLNK